MLTHRRVWLVLSLGIIVLALPPWLDIRDHSHWSRVAWIPFVSKPMRLRDIAVNLALFTPFGAAVALNTRRHALLAAGVAAAAVSVAGEWTQLYSHSRFPSMTDVVCNVVGALAAAVAVRQRTRVRAVVDWLRGPRP